MAEKEIEAPIITLTLEDDTEMECVVISVFPVDGIDYVALLPAEQLEDDNDEEGELFLYRYKELADDEIELTNIETDEEFERVSEAFDQILDEEEFNSID